MTVKLKRAALLLEGGPLGGHGYYTDDFERLRLGDPRLAAYAYDRDEIHPQTGASRGGQLSQRWVWQGPELPAKRWPVDSDRCTRRGCDRRPTHELRATDGARVSWYGCDEHTPEMAKAMLTGLTGASSGTGWVEDRRIVRKRVPKPAGEPTKPRRKHALPFEIPPVHTRMWLAYEAVRELGPITSDEVSKASGLGGHVAVMLGAMVLGGLLDYDLTWGTFEVKT